MRSHILKPQLSCVPLGFSFVADWGVSRGLLVVVLCVAQQQYIVPERRRCCCTRAGIAITRRLRTIIACTGRNEALMSARRCSRILLRIPPCRVPRMCGVLLASTERHVLYTLVDQTHGVDEF